MATTAPRKRQPTVPSGSILMSAAQMRSLAQIVGQHSTSAYVIESTNLHNGNVVAVKSQPGDKTWLVTNNGKVTEL